VAKETDPLQVLRWAATLGSESLTRAVEDRLRAAELKAAPSATPTPYAYEVLIAAREKGRRVAIASNNSAPAIHAYLDAHRLSQYVSYVAGRKPYRPEKMKPHPYTVLDSLNNLDAEPHDSVLIGDSPTDITASRVAGVHVIGYANKPGKLESLSTADAVVTTLAEVAHALNVAGGAARLDVMPLRRYLLGDQFITHTQRCDQTMKFVIMPGPYLEVADERVAELHDVPRMRSVSNRTLCRKALAYEHPFLLAEVLLAVQARLIVSQGQALDGTSRLFLRSHLPLSLLRLHTERAVHRCDIHWTLGA
jgi:beta-phosphoglucomutase-like phosphatase (HAD superfamily)